MCEQLDEEHILFTKSEDRNISIRVNAEFVSKIYKHLLDQVVYIKRLQVNGKFNSNQFILLNF